MLTGSKTYLLCLIAIGIAVAAFVLRAVGINQMLEGVFAALAVASARAGVKKIEIATGLLPPTWAAKIGGFMPNTKTHLAVAFLILVAVLAWLQGEQGLILTAFVIAGALGMSALRAALARVQAAVHRIG